LRLDTQLLEFWAGMTLLIRGVWMILLWHFVDDLHGYVLPPVSVQLWAATHLGIGLTQMLLGRTHQFLWRAVIASMAAMLTTTAIMQYFRVDEYARAVVPLLAALVLMQMFIAYRAWSGFYVKRRLDVA
jgi:hypothetical protein